ncbi:MAG: DUF6231 family protein [Acidiferrobacterales bacterium]
MSRPVYTDDFLRLLDQLAPRSLLVLDSTGTELFTPYLQSHPECQLDHVTDHDIMSQLQTRGRYALCFAANTLEHMDKSAAGQVLARLRDVHAERLFVVAPIGETWRDLVSHWEMTDFIGYGMRLVSSYQQDGKPLQMYKFDISDYKHTPDWLSPKNWANPERWDKGRW